jgi:hypothetical protein
MWSKEQQEEEQISYFSSQSLILGGGEAENKKKYHTDSSCTKLQKSEGTQNDSMVRNGRETLHTMTVQIQSERKLYAKHWKILCTLV